MSDNKEFKGYIKYFGPFTEDGSLDIAKAGKSLLTLDRFFKKYQKDSIELGTDSQYIIKISDINRNCSEIIIKIVEVIQSTGGGMVLTGLGLKLAGVDEFGKKFFGTLGEQLSLRIFAKGKEIRKEDDIIENNQHFTILKNLSGNSKKVPASEWENYKKLGPYLGGFVQLEKGREEEMRLGYKQNGQENEIAIIKYEEKDYFDQYEGLPTEERMSEPFDESRAKDQKIVGKFVDFYGLAHKYHFAFQARKNQDDIGKQKILCIVDKSQISRILDYLKPENDHNVCIFGKALRDWENKVDKIKIKWVNEDENYNPDQLTLK